MSRTGLFEGGVRVLAALGLLVACVTSASADRPSVVLITLDTTRPDHLGCYGYAAPTSPNLDRFAQDARVHTRAYSTTSWTLPAHASLFTGRFPASHGARLDPQGTLLLSQGIAGGGEVQELRARGLAPGERTLAQLFSAAGYSTGAVVGGPWMKRVFTLDRGFAHYDDAQISDVAGRLAGQVTDAAIAWIDTQAGRPFFLFLNYYDPHSPYEDPEGLIRRFLPPGTQVWPPPGLDDAVYTRAAYDGEILYMDRHIGRLLDHLRERGLYDRSWIVVTADHGELLGEHGAHGHGRTLYEEEIRIPLLVKRPGSADAGHSERPIQLTDVFSLLAEGAGLASAASPPPPAVFAETRPLSTRNRSGRWRAWLDGERKLVSHSLGERHLYDLSAAGESQDLAASQPERVGALEAAMQAFLAGLPAPEPAREAGQIDESTRRALEALGYLE